MHDQQSIGDIERHVERLPDPRSQKHQPEVMAGGGHQEKHEQGGDAERLEREVDEFCIVRPGRQFVDEVHQIVLRQVPCEQEAEMRERDEKRQHSEMTPVVQQRQEAAVEPRQRADRQDNRQHEERAGPGGAYPDIDRVRQFLRRM